MKEKNIGDIVVSCFVYLIIGTLMLAFFSMIADGFIKLLMWSILTPAHFVGLLMTLGVLYWFKRDSIKPVFAGLKKKISK